MTTEEIIFDVEERMEKAVDVFKHALTGIRTGRANPGLVIHLARRRVLRSNAVENRSESERLSRRKSSLAVNPGTIKDIEKAIRTSDLSHQPFERDGRAIRISAPPPSTNASPRSW